MRRPLWDIPGRSNLFTNAEPAQKERVNLTNASLLTGCLRGLVYLVTIIQKGEDALYDTKASV